MTYHVTGKLINFSDNNVNMSEALADITSMMQTSYSGIDNSGNEVRMNFNFSVAETM